MTDEPVHSRHFHDGYPLCWTYEQDGEFNGSYDEAEVTCPACLTYLGRSD